MTSQICSKAKMQKGRETHDANGTAIIDEDVFRKISVPSDASCLFWAVSMAYLLPVKNNKNKFGERYRRLFGVKGEWDLTRVKNLFLNQPLNLVYEDHVLIELVVEVFRNRVADEIFKQEKKLSQSVTKNDFLRAKNEGGFIADGTLAQQFQSAFPPQVHLVDSSELKPSQLDERALNLSDVELDKVSDKNETKKLVFRSYVNLMRSCKSWGGRLEIEAIEKLLQCQIILINSKENARDLPNNNLKANNIYLFNSNEIYYEFALVKAKFVIETLKRKNYQLSADCIDLGVDKIDYQDENGDSLLHLSALSNNQNDVINLLIWQGADVNITDDNNQTPLDVAIDFKLDEAIAILDLYPKRVGKKTARGLAFIEKSKISNKVTTGISNVKNEETNRHAVSTMETQTTVHNEDDSGEIHTSHFDNIPPQTLSITLENPSDDLKSRALYLAIISNRLNVVENLIENGADVNAKIFDTELRAKDSNNLEFLYCSPLHCAAEKGYLNIVKMLISKYQAEVDFKDSIDGTPLQKVAKFGHLKVVKYLLGKGANVNSLDKTFICVLSNAAIAGHCHVIQYLIENGADINSIDQHGMTPLHHAVESHRWRVVQYLAEHKADLNVADKNDKTVLDKVIALGEWNVVKYLLEKGASLINSTVGIRNDIFKRFINDESNIRDQIYQAIKLGNVEVLEILLNSCDRDKSEAMLAKAYDELHFCRVQLNHNIHFFIKNKLLDFRFFSNNKIIMNTGKKSATKSADLNIVKDRLNLVISCIDRMFVFEMDDYVSDTFLYIGKFIAHNLQILKRQLPSTYELLPWEEMQFCLLTFISGYTHQLERDIINELVLCKAKLLSHLDIFRKVLVELEARVKEEDVKDKKSIREKVMVDISEKNPGFKMLYKDFEILKDVYSLKRIEKHIRIACSVDLKVKPMIGQLAVERAVQVIGECLKNTLDSPNLSDSVQKMLISSAPLNVKPIITSLRDSLSHANINTSSDAGEVENSPGDSQFFTKMQEDLKKLETDILFILVDKRTQAIIAFLERISRCENVRECRSAASGVHTNDKVTIKVDPKMYSNFFKIRNFFIDLKNLIKVPTEVQIESFGEIFETLDDYKTRIELVQSEHAEALSALRKLIGLIKNSDSLASIKDDSRRLLILLGTSIECYGESASVYSKLSTITFRLRDSVLATGSKHPHLDRYRISNILCQLFSILNLEVRRIKSLETYKFTFEKENYYDKTSGTGNDNILLEKIETKVYAFIDTLSDTKTQKLFKDEYVKKKEVYKNKARVLNEKNVRGLNRKTDSYEILVTKLKKEPIMIKAFTEFIKSFDAHKKLSPDFANSRQHLFFDGESYFEKLQILANIFGDQRNGYNCEVENLLRENDDIRAAVEMLMLTLLEILETMSLLDTNRLFLDEPSPILVGKNLRNYLAHGDLLIDILSIDHVAAIISHYHTLKRISDEEKSIVYPENFLIGKLTTEDISKLKKKYELKLELLEKQHELFAATLSGDETAINHLIDTGVEIKINRADESTLLHVAVLADNVKLFKFLLNYNVNLYRKDIFGNSIIYYVIKFGRKNILKFLYNRFSIDLDAKLGSNVTLMHLASQCDQMKVIKFLISNGADVDIVNSDGLTPLQFATRNGHLAVVVALYEAGANLGVKNKAGLTLLHLASSVGFLHIVEYLIEKNVDIYAKDNNGRTPLHYACMFGHGNIVDVLLKHKADVNTATIDMGETPLHSVSHGGDDKLVQTLLDHKADLHAVAKNGNTALHYAALNNNIPAAVILLRNGVDIEAKSNQKVTPLLCAAFNGHYEMIKTLLGLGANVNAMANEQTALHVAAIRNHVESVKALLINDKVDVNIKNKKARTALHLAAQRGNVEIIGILLASKSNINEVDKTGKTALHLAVLNNRNAAVESLISNGSDIDPRDGEGSTPLLIACKEGNVQIFEMLRDKNANILIKNHIHLTPFYIALANGHIKILEKILPFDDGKDCEHDLGKAPLHLAAFCGHDNIVKLLIKKGGAHVNAPSLSDKSTPLHLAAQNGHDTTVTQLLNLGADVQATYEPFLKTALHEAAENGHAYVADILMRAGARVDALTTNNETPLHAAAINGQAHIIPLLVKNKACVMAKDIKMWTPMHTAAFFGFPDFIMKLLSYGAKIEELTDGGLSVMHIASHHGHLNVVKALLTLDESFIIMINQLTVKGESPLYLAVRLGHFEVAEWLIKHGADVFSKNFHDSVLHQAVKNSKILKLVLTEIRNKCDENAERLRSAMNVSDGEGDTPLMWATKKGNVGSAILLLQNDEVDIDRQNVDGRTALHWLAQNGDVNITQLLIIVCKANEKIKDKMGWTALHWAAHNGHRHLVSLLISIMIIKIEVAQECLNRKADIVSMTNSIDDE